MAEEKEESREMKLIREAVEKLSSDFDAVMIFASHHDGIEGTRSFEHHSGNIFARVGQVREWLIEQDEFVRIKKRKELEDDSE